MQAVTPGAPPPAFEKIIKEIEIYDTYRTNIETHFTAANNAIVINHSICKHGIRITSQLASLKLNLKVVRGNIEHSNSEELKTLFNNAMINQRKKTTEFCASLFAKYDLVTKYTSSASQKEIYKLGKKFVKVWGKVDRFAICNNAGD